MEVARSKWPRIDDVTQLEHFLPDQPAAGRGLNPADVSRTDPTVQRQPNGPDPDEDGVGGHAPRGEARTGHIAYPNQFVRQKTIQELEDHRHSVVAVATLSRSVGDVQHLPEVQLPVHGPSKYLVAWCPADSIRYAIEPPHGMVTSKTRGPATWSCSPSSDVTNSSRQDGSLAALRGVQHREWTRSCVCD